jgi:hypothetical protein
MASAASGDTAKEIKAQLKQARELITQKDHTGALKICEVIIHSDVYIYIRILII